MRGLLVSIALCGILAEGVAGQPRLAVLVPNFDFGNIPQNSTVQHRYWFHSVGSDTLRINEIKTGCSCALMPLERDWIAPGDSLPVTITWKLGRHIGAVNRSPRVFTNAGPDPVRLQLRGSVILHPDSARPMAVRPFRFEFGRTSLKDIDSLEFTLISQHERDLTVQLISLAPPELELDLPAVVPGFSEVSGSVRLKPEYADTEFETSLTLGFSDEKNTHVTIPVRRKFYMQSAN